MNPDGYESLDGRLKALKIVFALMAVAALAACVSDILEVRLMDRVIAGEDVTDAEFSADDTRVGIVSLLQFGLYIACVVVFLRWLHRAYKNLDAVAPEQRRYGHGWAIGGWFVPFLNLWRPKEVINDIWRSGGTAPPAWLAWWWAAFLVTGWIGNFALRSLSDDTPQEFRDSALAYAVSDGLDVPMALLAILVAVKVTQRIEIARADAPPPRETEERFDRPLDVMPPLARNEDGTFPSYPA
ncbi:DUF4328 domain-containing protein [Solirubrobacter soli]|uniref:DUF4328 domain-containing protein n=1 Tax=Solirubrobacter soli TaxID=363832 RepID=UPI00041D470B|nr:DUF4328 domain-containing protein [Solirubrobacter soli]